MEQLQQGCQKLGIPLTEEQSAQFALYYDELSLWNAKLNLTAITSYEDVQRKHFLDSLVSVPLLLGELGLSLPLSQSRHLLDVGTGAGFPGIPLKIVLPSLKVTLMDGTQKKVNFLNHVIQTLGLNNIQVVQGRAEELGRMQSHRGQYDIVTARAVAPLNTLVEYLLPLCRRNGVVAIYKGANAIQEFTQAQSAIHTLGGETIRLAPLEVPFLDEKRFVILIKKTRLTPAEYPRGQGLARKRPLE